MNKYSINDCGAFHCLAATALFASKTVHMFSISIITPYIFTSMILCFVYPISPIPLDSLYRIKTQ